MTFKDTPLDYYEKLNLLLDNDKGMQELLAKRMDDTVNTGNTYMMYLRHLVENGIKNETNNAVDLVVAESLLFVLLASHRDDFDRSNNVVNMLKARLNKAEVEYNKGDVEI